MKKTIIAAILFSIALTGVVYASFTTNLDSLTLVRASQQYAKISSASAGPLNIATSSMTVSAWIYLNSTPPNAIVYGIVSKWDTTGSARSYMLGYGDDQGINRMDLVAEISNNATNQNNIVQRQVNPALTLNAWHFVAFSWDNTNLIITEYIDGQKYFTSPVQSFIGPTNTNADIDIGAANTPATANSFFDGNVDDVRIWSRKLSDEEIAQLYDNPCGFNNGTNLVAEYLFDNAYTDSSGNGLTLTAVNAPTFSGTNLPYQCGNNNGMSKWWSVLQ